MCTYFCISVYDLQVHYIALCTYLYIQIRTQCTHVHMYIYIWPASSLLCIVYVYVYIYIWPASSLHCMVYVYHPGPSFISCSPPVVQMLCASGVRTSLPGLAININQTKVLQKYYYKSISISISISISTHILARSCHQH